MSKHQTIGDILAAPPLMSEDSEIVEKMNRVIKKFDDYERVHGFRCAICDEWYPADEIVYDEEHGDLCKKHFDEVEEERELAEEEERNHHGEA